MFKEIVDRRTDDGHHLITKADLESMAQVRQKTGVI